jgi:four helix bundle protein
MDNSRSKSVASYRDLIVWQRAMDLVDGVYTCTGTWPTSETYGLTSQVRRAVVSIPANIAEGQSRNGRNEFIHHLGIARGSLSEVETLLLIASRQRFVTDDQLGILLSSATEVGKLLRGLIQSLSNS